VAARQRAEFGGVVMAIMREILFRGQLRRKGEKVNMAGEPLPSIWKYGGCAQYGGGAVVYQAEPEIEKFPVYSDTIGQYTGMTDKNGVKIFEGDIIKTAGNQKRLFIVFWSDKSLQFVKKDARLDDDTEYGIPNLSIFEYEVVGNIYDNPELLEEEEE
jgi:hypothetical protein